MSLRSYLGYHSFPLCLCFSLTSAVTDRTEGGAGGALAPPLFRKNKNKLDKK